MIYFIQNMTSKAIKIGFTVSDATGRLRQLQTASPDELKLIGTMPGTYEDERFLHERFAAFRLTGEWFAPVKYLLDWINWLKDSSEKLPEVKPINALAPIAGETLIHPEYGLGKALHPIDGERWVIEFTTGIKKTFLVKNSQLRRVAPNGVKK